MGWSRAAGRALALTLFAGAGAGCAALRDDPSPWFGTDKMAHFAASAALAAAASDLLDDGGRAKCQTATIAIGMSLAVGTAKEFHDVRRGGPFSARDMLANLTGAMTGALLATRCP